MKTLKQFAFITAATAFIAGMRAQPLTGVDTYQHGSPVIHYIVSSGGILSVNTTGFFLGGYQPSGTPNIYVDKTTNNGNIGSFNTSYQLQDGALPCGSSLSNATNCYGMSMIENNVAGSPDWYVLAAAFDRGCVFATLDAAGNVSNSAYYNYSGANPSKALIAPSIANPGVYYVCGSYGTASAGRTLYVLLVNSAGGVIWSSTYSIGTSISELNPTAIMESPYAPPSSPQLILVGAYNDVSTSNQEDGFCARLDGLGGSVMQWNTYNSGISSNDRINAIAAANSPVPGMPGYIVGGFSDMMTSSGTSWMMKLDQNLNVIWTDLIQPSSPNTGEVFAVQERFSSTYSQFEYYGATSDNTGMTVFKLDNGGMPFQQLGNTNNEFIYTSFNSDGPFSVALSDDNIAGDVNEGIHVYGTDRAGSPFGDPLLVRAYFNGVVDNTCPTATYNSLTPSNVTPGPNNIGTINPAQNNGLNNCTNFTFNGVSVSTTETNPCDSGSPIAGGNQSRTMAATGLTAVSPGQSAFSVRPNPVSDKLQVFYNATTGSDVSISVTNSLGQVVKAPVTLKAAGGEQQAELNLNDLNLDNGIYFITIRQNGQTSQAKIIYKK